MLQLEKRRAVFCFRDDYFEWSNLDGVLNFNRDTLAELINNNQQLEILRHDAIEVGKDR